MRIKIAWKMLLISVVINAKRDTLEYRKRSCYTVVSDRLNVVDGLKPTYHLVSLEGSG
jgi:hypothetical protein